MLEKPRNFVLGKRHSYSEIGAVFGIVPSLQNRAIWPAHTKEWRQSLGLSSDCGNGPRNLGLSLPSLAPIHRASPVSGRSGPNGIRPERRLLEVPMDRINHYP